MNEMHADHYFHVITQHQEKVAMPTTAENKRVFKSRIELKMKMNERRM